MIKEPKAKKLQIKMKNKAKSIGSLNKQSSKENTSKQNRRSPTKHKSAEPSVELSPPNENTPKQNRRSPRKPKSAEPSAEPSPPKENTSQPQRRSPRKPKSAEPSAEPSPSERATQTPKRRRVESAQSSQTTPKRQKEKNLKCVCQEGSHLHRASPNSGNASNNRASTSRTVCANGTASPPIGLGSDSTTPTSSPNGVQKPFKGQECKLLSWYNEGEVVADATIFETDPEKVVHGFLLGFRAYSVCVLCAHVQKAHLFRPTSEFQFVDEAQGSFVAWPKDKILF